MSEALDKIFGRKKKNINDTYGSGKYTAEVSIDVLSDEAQVIELLNNRRKFGKGWETTPHNCRWDGERKGAKLELKSRTYGTDFDTWIIDTYKIDYMLENFPKEELYFVNGFDGAFHIFDARYVATCPKKEVTAHFKTGGSKEKIFYVIPKGDYIMELKTGKRGKKA